MQVNFHSASPAKANPVFGQINLYAGSSYIVKRVLNPKEMDEFQKLVAKQKDSTIDLQFYSVKENSNKLRAILLPDSDIMGREKISQKFFEGTMAFIKRCCDRADVLDACNKRARQLEIELSKKKITEL